MSSLFTPQMNIEEPSANQVGRVGEILAAYYLELYGVQTEIVRTTGCDLWCNDGNGLMFTCEVKTSATSTFINRGNKFQHYRFNCRHEQRSSADIFALVALDLMSVKYVLPEDMGKSRVQNLRRDQVNSSMIFASIEECLQRIKKRAA